MALDWMPHTEQPEEGALVLIASEVDGNVYFESGIYCFSEGEFFNIEDYRVVSADRFFWILEHELMATVPWRYGDE